MNIAKQSRQPDELTLKLLERLRRDSRYLLTTHRNADADGAGAEIGLNFLLRDMGKDVIIVNQEPLTDKLRFLDTDGIIKAEEDWNLNLLRDRTIVFLDNSEPERAGNLPELIKPDRSNWIVIDHHDDTGADYRVFFRDARIGSTSEMIFELLEAAGVTPPLEVAQAIYAGIVSDTGFFRYGKTRPRTHEIAARLLEMGVNSADISERLQKNSPLERLYLKQVLFNKLKVNKEKNVAWFEVRRRDVEDLNLSFGDLGDLVNELIEPERIRAAVIFTERESNLTRASLRSKGAVNLLPAVAPYGGGGHKNACGASFGLDLENAVRELIPAVTECVLSVHPQDIPPGD